MFEEMEVVIEVPGVIVGEDVGVLKVGLEEDIKPHSP